MKITSTRCLIATAIGLALHMGTALGAELCGVKTLDRQGEVPANQTQCITDYGHYLYVNVPYANSNVTITTSGGTFSGTDAAIVLYDGNSWSGNVQLTSAHAGTNDESLSFVSPAGNRYFAINGNIAQTNLLVSISGGDIPPPMGDYVVFDTYIQVNLPAPVISSKNQYGPKVAEILAASYAGFEAIAASANDPITDVTQAIHYLASTQNLADADLNQLLYFLASYKYYAQPMTDAEAKALSAALQAVATMEGFLNDAGGVIQEGYAKALNNFERGTGANYFKDQLPHLLAIVQTHSLRSNPFATNNAGDATMAALSALGSAAYYGDAPTKLAFTNNMLDVISVLRSFAFLGETYLDMRWATETDRKWIVPHTLIAMGRVASIAKTEAQARLDSSVLEVRGKVVQQLSVETTETMITKNYLESAGRACESADPLFGHCVVPPKIEDVLTVNYACTDKIVIRAQSSISQATLDQSCADMALQEAEFHSFFNTSGLPVAKDKNAVLEVVAFASPEAYEKYAPEFFGISTDNGGMYLEGTPENDGNQARFIAMQCPDAWVGNSCQYTNQIYNLRHEFVHYLDGRYVKAGSYGAYDYNVSWSEGMAEYLSMGANHTRTLNTLKGKVTPPLYNLLFMAYGYEELYPWSYFAMRYLSEQHSSDVTLLANALKAGSNTDYIEVLKGVAARTEAGFTAYILANSETVAPAAAPMPALNSVGSCNLAQQYVRKVDANKTAFTVTNDTDTPVSLFWVDNNTGKANFAKNYKTLGLGENFTAATWSEGDRLMLTDNNMNCLGVAVMAPTTNSFTVDADLVANVLPEVIPSLNNLGSCELVKPHLILANSHTFTLTNTSDYAVRLFRIDNLTGKPMYPSAATGFDFGYGTLAQGDSYSSDVWFGDRRFVITDARLNCLGVGVLNNADADFTIDAAMVANAAPPEVIPAANTLGTCELKQKHLTGPFEAEFAFTNTTNTPVRIYRVDNETGTLSESFGFTTLEPNAVYSSATSWKWFGNRRAAITDTQGQCLAVAVMTEKDSLNDYTITGAIFGGSEVDSDGDGVVDAEDAFPNDASETRDSDGDGVGDNADAFPNNAAETIDTDGDGVGDNGDAFPDNPGETKDSDGDGVGDNSDAFPNDASETKDTDGDGIGDNSDAYPTDPNNGEVPTNCGAVTISGGKLTLGKSECIAGGRGSFYVWVDSDNTDLVLSTSGGNGDVGIYFNADTWATKTNAQAFASIAGTQQRLAVKANRGWRYITVDTSGQFSGVNFSVKVDAGEVVTPPPSTSTMINACASQSTFTYGAIESGKALCTGNGHNSYYIYLNVGVSSVDINTAHGSGKVSLYSGKSWPSATNHDYQSVLSGTTEQSIKVNNPPAGWYYITVDTTASNVAVELTVNN